MIDEILEKNKDGRDVRRKIKNLDDPTKAMAEFGPFGGMWIRNTTYLWRDDVTPVLAEDIRYLQKRHRIELLETRLNDETQEPQRGPDSRLTHPDNMSWVLITLYAEWLQGKLKFPEFHLP